MLLLQRSMGLEISPPFEGANGKWVRRRDFTGKKSFGRFCCTRCHKEWLSAHAQANYRQACKECRRYFLATHMWVNKIKVLPSTPDSGPDSSSWHKSDLCEACKRGVCKGMQDFTK